MRRIFKLFTLAAALTAAGCFDFGGKDEEATDAGPALVNFCHALTADGGDIDVELTVTSGDEKVILQAVTGGCSTPVDADAGCEAVPSGDDVSIKLSTEDRSLLKTSVSLDEDGAYSFYLAADTDSIPMLYTQNLTEESLECGMAACDLQLYTAGTCSKEDPCGWINDNYCDELCSLYAELPFDDSADCADEDR